MTSSEADRLNRIADANRRTAVTVEAMGRIETLLLRVFDEDSRVERLEARCDELNEACSTKQVLLDHTAADLRDMRDLYEKEKNTLREEVKVLRWFLREVQWCGKAPTAPDRYCPGCLSSKEEGHHTDCVITVALSNDKVAP